MKQIHWDRRPSNRDYRPTPAPKPLIADALVLLCGLGLGASMALALNSTSWHTLSGPGALLTLLARLCAMSGTFLLLVMVGLIARIPGLEAAVGHDRLVAWHRKLGGWPFVLILLHVIFVTLGYAQSVHSGVLHQFSQFLFSFHDIKTALLGTLAMAVAVALSIPPLRRLLAYEKWWAVHLSLYLALLLSLPHQLSTGVMFVGHPLARLYWIGLWLLTFVAVVLGRVALPLILNLRHQLVVESVEPVAPGVVSITLQGRKLERLSVSGGQFFQWRFLAPGLWFHAHPYSLSALPRPPFLRLTVKDLGDHSGALRFLRPGTRVFVEGPYGTFTHHRITSDKVTLIGAGVGVTPIRAMLDDLPKDLDLDVIVRASKADDLVHGSEIEALTKKHRGRYHPLVGPRSEIRLDEEMLLSLVPDIASGDVYLCGPGEFNLLLVDLLTNLGVAPEAIHSEVFAF